MAGNRTPQGSSPGWVGFALPVSSGSGASEPTGYSNATGITTFQFDWPNQAIHLRRMVICFKWALFDTNEAFDETALRLNRTLAFHPAIGHHGIIGNLTLQRYQQSNALRQNPYYAEITKLMTQAIPPMQVAHRSEGSNLHPGLVQTCIDQSVSRDGAVWHDAFIEIMDPIATNPVGWHLQTLNGLSVVMQLPTTLGVLIAPYEPKYSTAANATQDTPNPFFGYPGAAAYTQANWSTANVKVAFARCIYQWEIVPDNFTPTISFIFSNYNFIRQLTPPSKEFTLGFSTPQINLRRLQLYFRKRSALTRQTYGGLITNAVAITSIVMLLNNDPSFYTYPVDNLDYKFGISAPMPDNLIWPYAFGVNANPMVYMDSMNGKRITFDYDPYGPGLPLANTNIVAHFRLQDTPNNPMPVAINDMTLPYDNSLSQGPSWELFIGFQNIAGVTTPPARSLYNWYSFSQNAGYFSVEDSELTMVTLNTQRLTINATSQLVTNEPQQPDANSPPPFVYLTNFAPPRTSIRGAHMRMVMGIPVTYAPPKTTALRLELPNSGFLGDIYLKWQVDINDATPSAILNKTAMTHLKLNAWANCYHRTKLDALLGCSGFFSGLRYEFAGGVFDRKNLRRMNHLRAIYSNDSDEIVTSGFTTGQSFDYQLGPNGSKYDDVEPFRAYNMISPLLSATPLVSEPPIGKRYQPFRLTEWYYTSGGDSGSNSWYLLEDLPPATVQTATIRLRDIDPEIGLQLINRPLINSQRWYIDFYFDLSGTALAFVPASSQAIYWGKNRILDATVFSNFEQRERAFTAIAAPIDPGNLTATKLDTVVSSSFLRTIYNDEKVYQAVKPVLDSSARFQSKFFVQTLIHSDNVTSALLEDYIANGFELMCLDVVSYKAFIRNDAHTRYAGNLTGATGNIVPLTDNIPLPVSNMVPICIYLIHSPTVYKGAYTAAWDGERGPKGYNMAHVGSGGAAAEFRQVSSTWQQEYLNGIYYGSAQLPHAIGKLSPFTQTYPIGQISAAAMKTAQDPHMMLKPLFDNQSGFTQPIGNSAWNYVAWGMIWNACRKFIDFDLQVDAPYRLATRSNDNLYECLSKLHKKLPPLFMQVIPWMVDRAPFMNCQFITMGYTFAGRLEEIAYPSHLAAMADYSAQTLNPPIVRRNVDYTLPRFNNQDGILLRNYVLPMTEQNLYTLCLPQTAAVPGNFLGPYMAYMAINASCSERLVLVRMSMLVGPAATVSQYGNGARLQTIGTAGVTTN